MNRKRLTWPLAAFLLGCASLPAGAEDIALSFLHNRERVDVPVSAIRRIEAHAPAPAETRQPREFSAPHVEVCFTAAIRRGICRLTRDIIEEEPMEIVVGCKLVSKPLVRDPLCTQPCFQISVNDFTEAKDLAATLRAGAKICPSPTS
jgi:preprotein translocase subunit SecD